MEIFGLGKRPDPVEQAKEWKRNINREMRSIERDIATIQRQEQKSKRECKKLAQSGQMGAARVLAKEIVRTQKTIERLYNAKASMNSVMMQLQMQMATIKVQGAMQRSTEIMQQMSNLIKLPELQKTMMDMAREMEKAGLIEEMMEDSMAVLDSEGTEEAADAEVDRVIVELTHQTLLPAGEAPSARVPTAQQLDLPVAPEEEKTAVDEDFQRMQARLHAL